MSDSAYYKNMDIKNMKNQSKILIGSIVLLFCILTLISLAGCRSTPKGRLPLYVRPEPSTLRIINDLEAQQKLLQNFAKAYPNKIRDVKFLNEDWSMLVNDKRFYFANGRFLPEELRKQWEEYLPYDFYVYPWTGTAKERQIELENPVYSIGSSFLFDTLYSSPTEEESLKWQVNYSFFGVPMLIHSDIKPLLDKISDLIHAAAQTEPSVNEWIAELQTTQSSYGWNWRNIADTNRRSNHSYGIAIDLLPIDLGDRLTYWRWNMNDNISVKTIDSTTYYLPPETVIKIFEEYGFIWGGSWSLIDTMHFEYRPEILLVNGIEPLNMNNIK